MSHRIVGAARATAVTLALAGATLVAQAKQPRTTKQFETPDGSRFVLIQDDTVHQVHWAIASWIDGRDDPRGLEGLARATMRTSLSGTWEIGSRDTEAERKATAELDAAQQRLRKDSKNEKLQQQVAQLRQQVEVLGDPRTYRRVLAATPTHRPEILLRDPLAVLVLTTVQNAIPDVAKLLVQRRENLAMRGLPSIWDEQLANRIQDRKDNRDAPMKAELLALQMPLAPTARMLEWPQRNRHPSREQALACWQAAQHPRRTVHVLFGSFDLAAAEKQLTTAFATTQFPEPPALDDISPRPLSAERRSVVSGYGDSRLSIAWTLPATRDRWGLKIMADWLGNGEQGQLQKRLRRQGFKDLQVRCMAPWPIVEQGRSMLLIEIRDPHGKPELVENVQSICAMLAKLKISNSSVFNANMALQHEWSVLADSPRQLAAQFAEHALLWPRLAQDVGTPPRVNGNQVQKLLRATLSSKPAIVEGRK